MPNKVKITRSYNGVLPKKIVVNGAELFVTKLTVIDELENITRVLVELPCTEVLYEQEKDPNQLEMGV